MGSAVNFTYDPNYPRLATVQNNWGTLTYTYYSNEGDQRLHEITNLKQDACVLSKQEYAYSPEGQITQWTQQVESATALRYDLGYDKASQLKSAVVKNTATNPALQGIKDTAKAGAGVPYVSPLSGGFPNSHPVDAGSVIMNGAISK